MCGDLAGVFNLRLLLSTLHASSGESAGDLKERKQVEATCTQCGQKYTEEELTTEGYFFFVSLPLEQRLTSELAPEEVARSLKSSLQKLSDRCDPTAMGDIMGGAFYRRQREELNLKMDVTITVNSDGSPLFISSKFSIWPVQMTMNELPPNLRCKNLTILMLWYGQSHPDMTLVLQAFAKQMDLLTKTGVEWTCDGETFISKAVYCVCCSADSPSRALMQNMVQYTGYYGCGWYLHPGKTVEAYYIESPQLLKEIDERLCHIKFPQCMARLPRSVLLRKFWKATEWQQWLLYLSLVVRPDLCGRTHATLSLLPACGPQRQQ
ncbi:hypothetical protein HPB47_004984 [Ixodes persulcatus]|uniref:Uncharacterized protein n=1 Tax=Ixodes persulcatus TaxID=34615 RepID=A0AC60PEZ7_IXOPE|nr:hypothetical protein HPB47_004984 [Ixodes persulcatus]